MMNPYQEPTDRGADDGPYVIRLAGPWERVPLQRTWLRPDGVLQDEVGEVPAAGRVRLPDDWSRTLGEDFHGRVQYTRRFGRPTNLDETQRVELVIDAVDTWAEVTLNGAPLGDELLGRVTARFDVTRALLPRNELVLAVQHPRRTEDSAPLPFPAGTVYRPGCFAQVRLEIFG